MARYGPLTALKEISGLLALFAAMILSLDGRIAFVGIKHRSISGRGVSASIVGSIRSDVLTLEGILISNFSTHRDQSSANPKGLNYKVSECPSKFSVDDGSAAGADSGWIAGWSADLQIWRKYAPGIFVLRCTDNNVSPMAYVVCWRLPKIFMIM